MTPRRLAIALVILGGTVLVAGVAMLSIPLALIVAGAGIVAFGLLAVEVRP